MRKKGRETLDGSRGQERGSPLATAANSRLSIFAFFADILDYPGGSVLPSAGECARQLDEACPEAAASMRAFAAFAGREGLDRMEEIYTRTFDVTPTTTLYAGYHLFGEAYKRGAFLVRLQEEYKRYGFSFGNELADHLCVLLRFLSIADDPEFVAPLVDECILPALGKIEQAFGETENGYRLAISSLRGFLEKGNSGEGTEF